MPTTVVEDDALHHEARPGPSGRRRARWIPDRIDGVVPAPRPVAPPQ